MANEVRIKFIPDGDQKLINAIKKLSEVSKKLTGEQQAQFKSASKVSQQFRNLDTKLKGMNSSMAKAGVTGKLLTNALKGNRTALEQTRIAVKKHIRELKGFTHRTRILGGTLAVLRSKLLLFNFAMGFAIRAVSRFAVQSAKVESMSRAFDTLSGGVDNSQVALRELQEATNGTMSEFDLFQQANNAMVLGVAQNSEQMAEMFDIAQRLGRALGRDTASSVESLVTGIGRQSRLMLDNIGIIVKAEEAYDKYARKLGTTADKLTDAQKKQAFLEATMESARTKVETLGEETTTTQDAFDRLSSSTANLVTFLGDKLSPITSSLANNLSDMADAITGKNEPKLTRQEELNKLLAERDKLATGFNEIFPDDTVTIDNFFDRVLDGTLSVSQEQLNQAGTIEGMKKSLDMQIAMYNDLLFVEKERLQLTQSADTLTTENLTKQAEVVPVLADKIAMTAQNYSFLDAKQLSVLRGTEMLSNAFAQATLHGQNFGDAVVNSLKAIASQLIAKAGTYALMSLFAPSVSLPAFAKFLFAHTGGYIRDDKTIQRFATGGVVQGEDNVPIMAQAGEFVMSRNAVESIGIDNLARMNRTGNAGVTINIQGNMIGNEEFVRDTLMPEINRTVNQGLA